MRVNRFFVTSLIALAIGCGSKSKETPNGLRFEILKEGGGRIPKPGDVVAYNFKIVDSTDSVWNDTFNDGFHVATKIRDSTSLPTEKGLNQMLRMISEGDSITVRLSAQEYFEKVAKRPMPAKINPKLNLRYEIKIDTILSYNAYRAWVRLVRQAEIKAQLAVDTVVIDSFLTRNGINAQRHITGFRYVIHKEGRGPTAKSKQIATVNYTGYLLNGKYFETSLKSLAVEKGIYAADKAYGPLGVTIDKSYIIAGWHFALKLMKEGTSATFYFPSTLAYGSQKLNDNIQKNSILVFDIEVLDLKESGDK